LLAYTFDGCYGPEATQISLFATDVVPVLERTLKGYNATIFAYGNTGAGKTFTMEGTLAAPGILVSFTIFRNDTVDSAISFGRDSKATE
jgi:hypothetical protein